MTSAHRSRLTGAICRSASAGLPGPDSFAQHPGVKTIIRLLGRPFRARVVARPRHRTAGLPGGALGWTSVTTPPNPGDSLSRRRKLLYILMLGALTALGPFTVDLYLPAFPALEDKPRRFRRPQCSSR